MDTDQHEKFISEMKDRATATKILILQNLKISYLKDLIKEDFKPKTLYSIVTQKKIARYVFTEYVIKKYGVIDELLLSTYRIGTKTIKVFKRYLQDGSVKKIHCLVSQNYKMLLKDKASILDEAEKTPGFSFSLAYNHSKISLIKSGDIYMVVTGSGNYSENDHIEEYQVLIDKGLYNFHKEWILGGQNGKT